VREQRRITLKSNDFYTSVSLHTIENFFYASVLFSAIQTLLLIQFYAIFRILNLVT